MIQPNYAQLNPQYPQPGGANAVSINIYNPQAYGQTPQTNAQTTVPQMTSSMYQMPQAQMYQMPQAQMYQMPQQDAYYQQFMPMQNPMMSQAIAAPAPQMVQQAPVQQVVAPAPQEMPESVVTQAPAAEVQAQPAPASTPAVEVKSEETAAPKVDTNALVQGLKSTDVNEKAKAINEVAKYAQEAPEIALQVVSEPVMQGLIDIINEDTSSLEGPSAKQIEIAEKIAKGETLTPEENALSDELSPRDAANKNRIFALYTLAMIQKLQRDELDQYIEAQKANGEQTINPLKIQELIGYNDIVNVIKNDARPEVKVAAIQALQYAANPEDKAVVEEVLADSLKSSDEAVKSAATEAMAQFNA